MSCAAALQKYDLEWAESQRKWQASQWGIELKDNTSKPRKPSPSNGQKQTMTAKDITRNYTKIDG